MSVHYDYVLAGGGGAGLSLALHLLDCEALQHRNILLVDREAKRTNDRTWCFWASDPLPYRSIAHRSWDRLRFIGGGRDLELDLGPYRYQMLRSDAFYRYALKRLHEWENVTVLQAEVEDIADEGALASVVLRPSSAPGPETALDIASSDDLVSEHDARDDGAVPAPERLTEPLRVTADYVFDSTWDYARFTVDESKYHNLKQHFLGRVIRAPYDIFEADRATMFDFRTAQDGVMRFVYTMPANPREALVEYTLFSHDLLSPAEYDERLNRYIRDIIGLNTWTVLEEESCIIPMTDYPFKRRPAPRILRIGTRGGRVKASTGYAFARMQRDAEAITASLAAHNHPFDLPVTPKRYGVFDSILLQVLHRHGHRAEQVFTNLFLKNPTERIFRFLDEDDGRWENVKLMSTVPLFLFLKAGARVLSGKAP
ncbi:MAG: lycopene cyclase family protein [Spirochaetales bacterium]